MRGAFIRINTVFYCIKYNVFQRMKQIVIDITSPTPLSFCSFIVLMKQVWKGLVIDTLSFMKEGVEAVYNRKALNREEMSEI